jgi:hypothetical protein
MITLLTDAMNLLLHSRGLLIGLDKN